MSLSLFPSFPLIPGSILRPSSPLPLPYLPLLYTWPSAAPSSLLSPWPSAAPSSLLSSWPSAAPSSLLSPWPSAAPSSLLLIFLVLLVECSEFVPPDGNYTACQGDNVTLSCSIDDQVTRVAWLNRSNILYAGNDKWSIDPRVQLLNYNKTEFSIIITQLDVADEGLYTCSYQTQDKPHTTQAFLIVQVPARIVNISSSITVNEGSNVNLMCLAVGKPEPTVTWKQLREGFSSEGELLEITEINRQQAGEYECITSNGVSMPDSKKVMITVNYPPFITDVKNAEKPVGQSAVLRCKALAEPTAEFEWFKDDKRLTAGMEGLKIQSEKTWSVLLFSNVTSRHYGNYTCLASNKLGSYNSSVRLLKPGSTPNHSAMYTVSPLLLAVVSFTLVSLLRTI